MKIIYEEESEIKIYSPYFDAVDSTPTQGEVYNIM
jgi:hypothetical protein